jgi:PBP1b-binding outer membrane lipoprotein LpoB
MKLTTKTTLFMLVLSLLLAACATATQAPQDAMMDKPAEEAMMDKPTEGAMMDKPTEEAMMDKPAEDAMMDKPAEDAMTDKPAEDVMMETPPWFSASLTNAASGERFTIQDLKGKVVLVETLAMWCSNCRKQQEQVKALHALLGERDDFVSLGLDIDPNENTADLKTYIEKNGFDWTYAVAPAEVGRELGQTYGEQFLNPPSTPMLIIDRHGVAHPLPFGIKSAEALLEALQPFLEEGM